MNKAEYEDTKKLRTAEKTRATKALNVMARYARAYSHALNQVERYTRACNKYEENMADAAVQEALGIE